MSCKKICTIYDTFKELLEDNDVYENMIVMTLGYDEINDKKGATYKIITKDEAYSNGITGRPLSKNSPLFAMTIFDDNDVVLPEIHNYDDEIRLINDTLKQIGDKAEWNEKRIDNIIREINSNPTDVKRVLELDGIKIIQLNNGTRYIIAVSDELSKINISLDLSEENSWVIPSIITVSDYKVDSVKVGTSSEIKYQDNKLIFNIDFTKIKKYAVEY